jgi:hypothetical protein
LSGREALKMWKILLLTLGMVLHLQAVSARADRDDDGTAVTDRRRLILPVQLRDEENVTAVRLFMSKDKGKTWQLTATIPPTAREFIVSIPGEGTYWFSVQTVGKDGKFIPEDVSKEPPGVKVRVISPMEMEKGKDKKVVPPPEASAVPGEDSVQALREEVRRLRVDMKGLDRRNRGGRETPTPIAGPDQAGAAVRAGPGNPCLRHAGPRGREHFPACLITVRCLSAAALAP